ncbi:Uncharacterized protein Rs2_39453 [Raphanus sativus]|uniref:Uncharacterized protein LOC108824420 n=1 Tax=Raphanus sativus TaxID=3726 RepID=A0A6J0KZL3_RAPSA|nr:uncharacterized protein LOC108824420 [Raphanus sativus]KAJ4874435.1 Uncharacterized protein Rs2_39453 [Raphanus sativus]
MAADVSSLVRLLNGYNDDRTVTKESSGAKSAPMTRDLLGSRGGGGGDRSLELDLDLQVPTGWEKRLDLKSGKVYLQRCNSTSSSTITNSDLSSSNQTVPTTTTTTFQDLNFPPNPTNPHHAKPLLNLFDDTSPELKLRPSHPLSLSPNRNFQSVCTLDKVKSALERAERDPVTFRKRQSPDDHLHRRTEAASPVAAGCPGCLSYVLVMKNNPRCPRCDTVVSLPTDSSSSSMKKKVKIDLNISI